MGPAEAFERAWALSIEVERALSTAFGYGSVPELEHLEVFGLAELGGGSLIVRRGGLVAWLTHLRSGAPERGLAEAQLTVWLGPDIEVPHLRLGFGVLPDLHFWLELLPRRDPALDLDALDRYHGPADVWRRRVLASGCFDVAPPGGLHQRAVMPPSAIHVRSDDPATALPIIEQVVSAALQEWLGWIDAAPSVEPEDQPYLAEHDDALRSILAELDPVVQGASTLFGRETGHDLQRALAGPPF